MNNGQRLLAVIAMFFLSACGGGGGGGSNVGSTMTQTISLQGTGATSVKAIEATVVLPAGVVLRTDATGKLQAGVFSTTGSASSGLLDGNYTPATAATSATLTLGFITTGSLNAGEIIIINADLVAGATAQAASPFTLNNSTLIDGSGNTVSTASLTM